MARNTQHPFFKARTMKEGYVVNRIDDYFDHHVCGDRGGFHTPNYGKKGGMLWPEYQLALNAAKHMVQQNPGHQYAVFKMVTIVEHSAPPINIIKV